MIRRRLTSGRRGAVATVAMLVLTAAAGVAIAAFAFKLPSESGASEALEVSLVGGSSKLSLANSRRGHAIVSGRRMVPGQRVRGTVRLRNRADRPVRLILRRRGLRSPVNATGARLAPRLHLLVKRTRPNGKRIYSGSLRGLGRKRAGRLRPGASRRYRFTVRFRDRGVPADEASGDNLLENARARVGFAWRAQPARRR